LPALRSEPSPQIVETPSGGYSQRTQWNVRASGGTLILTWAEPTGGTLLTLKSCRSARKPHLVIDLADEGGRADTVQSTRDWLAAKLPGGVLNVAGPRASKQTHVYDRARAFLLALLSTGEASTP
jgi:Circularly permutated YpsA SLOG family